MERQNQRNALKLSVSKAKRERRERARQALARGETVKPGVLTQSAFLLPPSPQQKTLTQEQEEWFPNPSTPTKSVIDKVRQATPTRHHQKKFPKGTTFPKKIDHSTESLTEDISDDDFEPRPSQKEAKKKKKSGDSGKKKGSGKRKKSNNDKTENKKDRKESPTKTSQPVMLPFVFDENNKIVTPEKSLPPCPFCFKIAPACHERLFGRHAYEIAKTRVLELGALNITARQTANIYMSVYANSFLFHAHHTGDRSHPFNYTPEMTPCMANCSYVDLMNMYAARVQHDTTREIEEKRDASYGSSTEEEAHV